MTLRSICIISFFLIGSFSIGQIESTIEDSCLRMYAKGGDLHLSFEEDSLRKALYFFDKVISSEECSETMKNLCRYTKAITLGKLDRDKEAMKLLNSSLYIDADSTFLAFLHQEKFFLLRKTNKNKKALKEISIAQDLHPYFDEFHYRKALVLYDLFKFEEVICELSKIKNLAEYQYSFHVLNSISAYKMEKLDLALISIDFIDKHRDGYGEKTINSLEILNLLITQKNRSLTIEEKEQLERLKTKDIEKTLRKELK